MTGDVESLTGSSPGRQERQVNGDPTAWGAIGAQFWVCTNSRLG